MSLVSIEHLGSFFQNGRIACVCLISDSLLNYRQNNFVLLSENSKIVTVTFLGLQQIAVFVHYVYRLINKDKLLAIHS